LIEFGILEMPGQLNISDPSFDSARIFSTCGAIIYVIDCQTEYLGAISNLGAIAEMAVQANPKINIEVLIHKIDGLSEDFRLDTRRDIIQRTQDELADNNIVVASMNHYLTSIYDRSIHEAFSKIIQKLIPDMDVLENLLSTLCAHSGIEKTFLFDINSKIYVATDSTAVDPLTYEVCTDFIDVTIDLDKLYDSNDQTPLLDATGGDGGPELSNGNVNGHGTISKKPAEAGTLVAARPLKSISRMHNGVVLYLCQMIRGLALVGFIRNETPQKMALIDYNVEIFSQSLQRIWSN
jgi:Ras-related GTP-binding protein C/D